VYVEPIESDAFAAGFNAVPLVAIEFANASLEFPIVSTQGGDTVMPAAVLGLRND
jgi:SapC